MALILSKTVLVLFSVTFCGWLIWEIAGDTEEPSSSRGILIVLWLYAVVLGMLLVNFNPDM